MTIKLCHAAWREGALRPRVDELIATDMRPDGVAPVGLLRHCGLSSARVRASIGRGNSRASPDVVVAWACKQQLWLQFWLQFTGARWCAPTFTADADLRQCTTVDVGGQRIPPS